MERKSEDKLALSGYQAQRKRWLRICQDVKIRQDGPQKMKSYVKSTLPTANITLVTHDTGFDIRKNKSNILFDRLKENNVEE